MQAENLSIVVTAAATVVTALAAIATLALGLFNTFADARRRKPHVNVTLRAGYKVAQDGRCHEYGAVLAVNDGQVALSIEQIGFYVGKPRKRCFPIEQWNVDATYRRIVVPGDFVEVVLENHMALPIGEGKPVHAFALLADGTEFRSKPIAKDAPGAFALV